MTKRNYSTRRVYDRRGTRSSAPRRSSGNLLAMKKKLNWIFVWLLVVVNVALIVFLVRKIFIVGDAIPTRITGQSEPEMAVEVLNGCGTAGVANIFSEILKNKNYDVVNVDNADSFDYEKSVVLDRGRQNRKKIERLSKILGISKDRILLIESQSCQCDATLIIGSDYNELRAFRRLR
ncbi:LytR C-terminal domain-containing protein [candidate division KSB1 bacterium]|nr:LytR C-terminal domain-containing protein [candidate division KSB1 bacterium]